MSPTLCTVYTAERLCPVAAALFKLRGARPGLRAGLRVGARSPVSPQTTNGRSWTGVNLNGRVRRYASRGTGGSGGRGTARNNNTTHEGNQPI